jgi:hypothetical protein
MIVTSRQIQSFDRLDESVNTIPNSQKKSVQKS